MPSTKGLETFIRKDQLADEEWFGLIEARRELIKPYLNSFTLPELGDLECLRREVSFKHMLRLDVSVTTGDNRFSLKTQGIFCVQPWSTVERTPNSGYCSSELGVNCSNGTMRVWGLTRSGLWVLITIGFKGEEGYKGRGYERAKTVEIVETDLPTIAAETKEKPQRIWEELGKAIKSLAENREFLYNQARNLYQMIQVEELVFSVIPRKI